MLIAHSIMMVAGFLTWCPVDAQPLQDLGKPFGLEKSKFPIRESGYWTCEAGNGLCVYWLDNERVIFNGSHPADMELTADGRRVWRHAIYIWNLRTDEVTKHADAARATICHVDGYVRYSRVEGDDIVIVAGQLGKEVEIARSRKGQSAKFDPDSHGWRTDLTCSRSRPKLSPPRLGTKIALKEGHGFLYFPASDSPAGKREGVAYFSDSLIEDKLPVAVWQVSPPKVLRNEFDNSYLLFGPHRENVLSGINTCPSRPVKKQIYRLTIDGKLETITIPDDPRLRCYVSNYALSRTGVLIYKGGGHVHNLNLSVLYRLREQRLEEVMRGVTTDRAVSPNGCLLAVGISSTEDSRKPISSATYRGHLKVIDLCSPR